MASGTIKNLGFNNTYVKLGSILINNQTTELTISLSDSYKNYKFIYIVISYYDSGYPAYGCVLIPSSLGPLYGSESLRFYDIEHNSEIKIRTNQFVLKGGIMTQNTVYSFSSELKLICMNDCPNIENYDKSMEQLVKSLLAKYPNPSKYEIDLI